MTSTTAIPTAPLPDPATDPGLDSPLLQRIVRFRWFIFALIALVHLAAFNGNWRIGRDGALYRDVARNLATGQGYTFRGQRETHIYPGLPRLLATVHRAFGPEDILRPTISLAIIAALGGLTLVIIYHLVRLHLPLWIAVCVTTGVAINSEFLIYCHDIMTDVPFLFGACLTLLGLTLLRRAPTRPRMIPPILLLAIGALVTISMRPTFWALALPGIFLSVAGACRSRRRAAYAIGALALLGLLTLWWMLDPRTVGLNPLAGKYESLALQRLRQIDLVHWPRKLLLTCEKEFPLGFLGLELIFPLGTLLIATLLAWWLRLFRRLPLWSLYVVFGLGMTLLLGGKPRYYLMILPLLLIAWALAVRWTALRANRWRGAGELVLLAGLALPTVPNLVRCADFIREQHGFTRNLTRKTYLEVCRGGKMLRSYQLAHLIGQVVPPGARVLGPEPRISSFISGRHVFSAAEIIPEKRPIAPLTRLKKLNPQYLAYAPGTDDERFIRPLIQRRLLRISWKAMVRRDDMYVVPISIPEPRLPPPDRVRRRPATRPATPIAASPSIAILAPFGPGMVCRAFPSAFGLLMTCPRGVVQP